MNHVLGEDFGAGLGISIGTNGISVIEHASWYIPPVAVWEGDVTPFEWHHLVVTVGTDRRSRIYLDGEYLHTGLQSGKLLIAPDTFGGDTTYANSFEGNVTLLRIYPDQLQLSEIQQANETARRPPPTPTDPPTAPPTALPTSHDDNHTNSQTNFNSSGSSAEEIISGSSAEESQTVSTGTYITHFFLFKFNFRS